MVEKQGHTPGPWSHDYRKTGRVGYSQEVFDQTGELIATAAWYPVKLDDVTTTTNREANARLIASAPDLLAAAIHARMCVPFPSDAHAKLGAAIKRATGEDSPANEGEAS